MGNVVSRMFVVRIKQTINPSRMTWKYKREKKLNYSSKMGRIDCRPDTHNYIALNSYLKVFDVAANLEIFDVDQITYVTLLFGWQGLE